MPGDIDNLKLYSETHRILSHAGLTSFDAILKVSDLELYGLFRSDVSRVVEVRNVVAEEMARLGYWERPPGDRPIWCSANVYAEIEADRIERIKERERAEAAWRERPERQRAAYWAPDTDSQMAMALALSAEMAAERDAEEARRARWIAENAEFSKRQAVAKAQEAAEFAELKRLGFSTRARNCLHNAGLLTIEAIANTPDGYLMREPNFGKRTLREVREVMAAEMARREVAMTRKQQEVAAARNVSTSNGSRLSENDAAYCAAAWASGQTQKSLAATFGYKHSAPVCIAIGVFLDKYSGRNVTDGSYYAGADGRKALVPAALAQFRATASGEAHG